MAIVDEELLCRMRAYCESRFGNARHWPWLAVYTELRGGYHDGWLPNDLIEYRLIPRVNPGAGSAISTFKTMDYRLFGDFAVRPLLLIAGGVVHDAEHVPLDFAEAVRRLRAHGGEVVIKGDGGWGGNSVIFAAAADVDPACLAARGGFVVQPSVRQHAVLARLHPESVNSLRIVTWRDHQGGLRVIAAVLKAGRGSSRLDNSCSGGLFMYLDSGGCVISDAFNGIGMDAGDRHPDSGVCYRDIVVPCYAQAQVACLEAHSRYPYAGVVGWDVCIDADGMPGMLEWNAKSPNLWLNEALIGPLLNTKEIEPVHLSR